MMHTERSSSQGTSGMVCAVLFEEENRQPTAAYTTKGLPPATPVPSHAGPQTAALLEPPLRLLDFHIRHQVSIHWGPKSGNKRQSAKPAGVLGCGIQYAKDQLPTDPTGWTSLRLPDLGFIEFNASD